MESAKEIIKRHCGDIEKRIAACHDRNIALALKERLCHELRRNCASEMIQSVLRRHVDQLMHDYFDQEGRNIHLEKRNNEE